MYGGVFVGKRLLQADGSLSLKIKACELVGPVFPLLCCGKRGHTFCDGWPERRKARVDFEKIPERLRRIGVSVNGVDRALWNTHRAVNALVGVNHQEVGAFLETIDRANINAVGIFAFDAGISYYMGHGFLQ